MGMDDETKAKLIALYWEHYDKSDALKNHQRGQWNDNHEYDEGFSDGMSEVFDALGIDPDTAMPEHIRQDRDEAAKRARALYEELGITLRRYSADESPAPRDDGSP